MYTYIHYSGAVIHTLFKSVTAKSDAPVIELCTCIIIQIRFTVGYHTSEC